MTLVETPVYYAGGGFPWGLLIIGIILYFLWQKGMFGGPGGRGGGDGRGFGGPRGVFDEWHREAHRAPQPQAPVSAAPVTPRPEGTRPQGEQPDAPAGATGPALERW